MKPTVLICDDDRKFLRFLGHAFTRGGFDVLTASDGQEVPDLLSRHAVDVVLLDLQMPGMNGWEVLRRVGRDSATADVMLRTQMRKRPKIVVLSGREEDDTASFVRHLGADAYLTKPQWSKQIVTTVRRVLAR